MSMPTVRAGFIGAAHGKLRLSHVSLGYVRTGQVLHFTGWHNTGPPFGTPFAFVSAPFMGDPVSRAAQIAQDLITLHSGKQMPAPKPADHVKSILGDLRGDLRKNLSGIAAILADGKTAMADARSAAGEFRDVVDGVKAISSAIRGELQAEGSNGSNGGEAVTADELGNLPASAGQSVNGAIT